MMLVYRHSTTCRCADCRTAPARRLRRRIATTAFAIAVALSPIGHGLAAGVRDVLLQGSVR